MSKSAKPEAQIDLTLDEIYALARWASDQTDDTMDTKIASALVCKLMAIYKYHIQLSNNAGCYTLRLKRLN